MFPKGASSASCCYIISRTQSIIQCSKTSVVSQNKAPPKITILSPDYSVGLAAIMYVLAEMK